MGVDIGGGGTLGVGLEVTLGTYAVPTKFIPIRSESLAVVEDKIYRMNLRASADRTGAVKGYTHVEGDIVFEVTPDVMPYFFYGARVVPARAFSAPTYTYTFTGASVAKPTTAASGVTNRRTLSLNILRSGKVFGYVGCVVSQLAFSIDNGLLMCTASMYGTDEAVQSAGSPSWSVIPVAGPGTLTLEYPTATTRVDVDTFSLTINDNATQANRLNGSRAAAYENWGEREVTFSYEADFDGAAFPDYTAFRAGTISPITFKAIVAGGTQEMTIVLNATAIDAYPVNLAGLGDVNRASISGHAFYNTTDAYTITVKTDEQVAT